MTSESVQMSIPEIRLPQRAYLARDKSGMTQAQLAEAMGVTRKTVTNIETGAGSARRPTLAAWALATGVPLKWLENGEIPAGNNPDGGESAPSRARTGDLRIKRAFVAPVVPLFGGDRHREGEAA